MENTNMENMRNGTHYITRTLYVIAIRDLEYDEHGHAFFHIHLTDGQNIIHGILQDTRIAMAKSRFVRKIVTVIMSDDDRIKKIEVSNEKTEADFGALPDTLKNTKITPVSDDRRIRLVSAKDFINRNFTVPVLVTAVSEKRTKNGDTYAAITVSDGDTFGTYNWWNVSVKEIQDMYLNKVIFLTVKMEQYPKVIAADLCDDYDLSVFIPSAPISSEEMYTQIMNIIKELEQTSTMAPVVLKLYSDNKEKLLRWGGAEKLHHAVYGGLLYHTYRMMEAAFSLLKVYPSLNRDLLILGVLVHDIGKLQEIDTNEMGVSTFTTDGTLEGHILLGIEMLTEAVYCMGKDQRPDPEEFRLLKHMIASHHGKREWGAAVPPAIPEAYALHVLDMLDSKMYVFEQTTKGLSAGETSDAVFALDGSHVYHPCTYGTTY